MPAYIEAKYAAIYDAIVATFRTTKLSPNISADHPTFCTT
jgi:hypothetical protein